MIIDERIGASFNEQYTLGNKCKVSNKQKYTIKDSTR